MASIFDLKTFTDEITKSRLVVARIIEAAEPRLLVYHLNNNINIKSLLPSILIAFVYFLVSLHNAVKLTSDGSLLHLLSSHLLTNFIAQSFSVKQGLKAVTE